MVKRHVTASLRAGKLVQVAEDRCPITIGLYSDLMGWREAGAEAQGSLVQPALSSAAAGCLRGRLSLPTFCLSSKGLWAPAVCDSLAGQVSRGSEPLLPSISAGGAALLVPPPQGPQGAQQSASGGCIWEAECVWHSELKCSLEDSPGGRG